MAQTYTVLNVEDLQDNRDLVRRILQSRGYNVIEAVNGLEGISKAVEIKPDLILMDINLPDIDGFSAVTKIRSYDHLTETPIIALTARNIADDPERAIAMGCDGYLGKPFGVKALLDAVSDHIGKPRKQESASTNTEKYLREQSASLVAELERKFQELSLVHQKLSAMHERLQRLDQAKTDFIHIASHELRTPLTMVKVYADMISINSSIVKDTSLTEMMEGMKNGVDRLHSIINDMISIVRVELSTLDLAYTPISLKKLIEGVVEEVGEDIQRRNLKLDVNLPHQLPLVIGDETQLSQVFNRLMSNAIKYTPDHGRILVEASFQDDTSTIKNNHFVLVKVQDTGIGIDQEHQSLIFEKFYTAAEDISLHSSSKSNFRGGGPGLGLTIAKGIVEAHDGRIWVESQGYDPQSNAGSTFHVLLPAHLP